MTSTSRDDLITQFVATSPMAGARAVPLPGDASTRRYIRLDDGTRTALLMDAPPAADGETCPPDADKETRLALGYTAAARLAGGRVDAFTSLARWLRNAGMRAPTVLAEDPQNGLALIEDFGGKHLKDIPATSADHDTAYLAALRALQKLRASALSPGQIGEWYVHDYDALALLTEAELLTQWYLPKMRNGVSEEACALFRDVWRELIAQLSAPTTLVLRDYHAENILFTDDQSEPAIIDFQDALVGQPAYDVVSLLEDARRDVPTSLAKDLLAEDSATVADVASYDRDYAILALQRNLKILGVFARLIHRDGRDKYAAFLPRVKRLVAQDLDRPAVAPIRQWTEQYAPELLADFRGQP